MRLEVLGFYFAMSLTGLVVAQQAPEAAQTNPQQLKRKPDDFLRVIPVDSMTLVIANQERLGQRGDALGKQIDLVPGFSASQALTFLHQTIGAKGLDKSGPLAVSLLESPNLMLSGMNWSLPVGDRAKLLKGFGVAKQQDQKDAVHSVITPMNRRKDFHLTLREDTAWLGDNKEAQKKLIEQKRLYGDLTAQQRAEWVDMDLVLHLGMGIIDAQDREDAFKELGTRFKDAKDVAGDVQLVASHLKRVMAGISFRDGIRMDMRVMMDGDPTAAKTLEKLVGVGQSSLMGLPAGNVVAAGAIRGTTEASATLSGEFASMPFWLVDGLLSRRSVTAIGSILKELAFEVDETAVGLYLNEQGSDDGLLSLVMVLTPRTSPQDLISEMRSLSSFINAREARDMRIGSATYDVEEVAKWIQQLAADDFVAREDAMAALRKIGPPILPELEKAMKSDDKLIADRAKRLRRQIGGQLSRTASDLLGDNLLSKMDPQFLFRRNAARPNEALAEIVLKPGPQTDQVNKQLSGLFGNGWKRVRFAILEDHVVVLFGSNTDWLKKASALVNDGKAPLQDHTAIKAFRQQPNQQRLTEWHFSMPRLTRLTRGNLPLATGDTKDFSSLTITHSPGEIRTNVHLPVTELKAAMEGRW